MEVEVAKRKFLDQIEFFKEGRLIRLRTEPSPEDDERPYLIKDIKGKIIPFSKVPLDVRVQSEIRMFGGPTIGTQQELEEAVANSRKK